jgi:hypothetical protein
VLTQRDGRRIFLSDAIVVMTAPGGFAAHHQIGFLTDEQERSSARAREAAADALGETFVRQVDVLCAVALADAGERRLWVERDVLPRLQDHYRARGLELCWDESLLNWAVDQQRATGSKDRFVRMLEDRLGEAVIPHLPAPGEPAASVLVVAAGGGIRVVPAPGTEASADRAKAS